MTIRIASALLLLLSPAIVGCSDDHAYVIAELQDPDPQVRRAAIRTLTATQDLTHDAMPQIVARLEDDDPSVRVAAALAILAHEPANPVCRPAIDAALRGGQGPVFLAVSAAGTQAEWAVPTLLALVEDRRPAIRALASHSLGEIAPADTRVVSALRRGLQDASPVVRLASERALRQSPPATAPKSP